MHFYSLPWPHNSLKNPTFCEGLTKDSIMEPRKLSKKVKEKSFRKV